jgi:sugar phosphate isomerase/epimerase
LTSLSMTTDYANVDTGDPAPYLRRIAEAGFTHVHWCHEWNTDRLYSDADIEEIGRYLAETGLSLLDLHSSVGPKRDWGSATKQTRQAGVELVRNRLNMTARLGGDAIIMHIPKWSAWEPLRLSLDEVEPDARRLGVRIALENGVLETVSSWLDLYGSDYLGLCYDSGHGNLVPDGLDWLERMQSRLICVHLHDNHGTSDEHNLIFSGTVDWPRLAGILAGSSYKKPISSESNMARSGITDEREFLARSYAACNRLSGMVAAAQS